MSETEPRKSRVKEPPPPAWWEMTTPHPWSDEVFTHAFCTHLFVNSTDRDLNRIRERAFRFIRNFMQPELHRDLRRYREANPL